MSTTPRRRLIATIAIGAGALVGSVVALVVVLNLHIWVGLEQGYAASPTEVFDTSVVLGIVDVVLVVVGAVLGGVVARRLTVRRAHDPMETSEV